MARFTFLSTGALLIGALVATTTYGITTLQVSFPAPFLDPPIPLTVF